MWLSTATEVSRQCTRDCKRSGRIEWSSRGRMSLCSPLDAKQESSKHVDDVCLISQVATHGRHSPRSSSAANARIYRGKLNGHFIISTLDQRTLLLPCATSPLLAQYYTIAAYRRCAGRNIVHTLIRRNASTTIDTAPVAKSLQEHHLDQVN